MSAYAHQMEREISFLSQSARTSDMGSHYERGFAISSFAATILIGALVVTGVSLLALLTALTIMLQSCQSKSAGVINLSKSLDDDSNRCKMLAVHAELNGLSADQELPLVCKEEAIRYITHGQYARDLEFAVSLVVSYVSSLTPQSDGLDIILIDADDYLPSIRSNSSMLSIIGSTEADLLKHILMLRLYQTLQLRGWQLVLVSRRPVEERNATMDHLASLGYTNWFLLIMRSSHETEMDSSGYMSRQRVNLEEEGHRIVGSVSSHMDALRGPFSGKKVFKLPDPLHYHF